MHLVTSLRRTDISCCWVLTVCSLFCITVSCCCCCDSPPRSIDHEPQFEVSVENLEIPAGCLSTNPDSAPVELCELVWQSEELRTCPIFQNPKIEMIKKARVEWGSLRGIVGAEKLKSGRGLLECDVNGLVSSIGRMLGAPSESVAKKLNVLAMVEVVCI